jgi:methionyl-tRNA formyltransferase
MMSEKIVFMGSPAFAVPVLKSLAERYEIAGVVTQPDKRSGRGRKEVSPPVKRLAQELGIPILQPKSLRKAEAFEALAAWKPDVIVVAAFGQILRANVLSLPPFGCVNVHGSLLPRWRGAAPAQAAILAGDSETGITIMKMDEGIDTGPILSQRALPIAPDETAETLLGKLSLLGASLLMDTLPRYLSGDLQPRPQPEEGATYAPMLKKEDGRLDFTRDAKSLERQVRAYTPWPGAFFEFDGRILKVHAARAAEGHADAGARLVVEKYPAVGTGEGLLILETVQPAGKKRMDGKAFLSGARNWVS